MDLGLQGKVAVVTGGSSGIGLATARLFLAEGAAVAICGRDENRLAAAKSSLLGNASEKQLLALPCDVLDKDAVGGFAAAVEQWMGRCDILVNNAGQARMSTFADTTDEAWREDDSPSQRARRRDVHRRRLRFGDGTSQHRPRIDRARRASNARELSFAEGGSSLTGAGLEMAMRPP